MNKVTRFLLPVIAFGLGLLSCDNSSGNSPKSVIEEYRAMDISKLTQCTDLVCVDVILNYSDFSVSKQYLRKELNCEEITQKMNSLDHRTEFIVRIRSNSEEAQSSSSSKSLVSEIKSSSFKVSNSTVNNIDPIVFHKEASDQISLYSTYLVQFDHPIKDGIELRINLDNTILEFEYESSTLKLLPKVHFNC